ncbi:MAG: DUF423 domain-containing protein [Chitinophagaceae bacterium]|nr:DUF423 domain-containing protein [Chitinophagaceae bacterium]
MYKRFLTWGCIIAALAVALGAFGAHGLKKLVPIESIATFETGVRYQFYHAFALLFVGILYERFPVRSLRLAGSFFLIGILLFSGSLYILTLLKATNTVGLTGIGAITPFGGLFFIGGWIALLIGIIKK